MRQTCSYVCRSNPPVLSPPWPGPVAAGPSVVRPVQCDGGDGRQAGAGAGLVTAPPLLRPHLQRLLLWSEEADTWLD